MEERIVTLPDDYSSHALREGVGHLRSPGRKTILDLGRPSGDNVRFFSELNCRLFISDFFDSLVREGTAARQSRTAFTKACARLLEFPPGTCFDLVLLWDLLNYLDLTEVGILTEHLRSHCRPGTRMIALLSIYRRIPDEPFQFFASDPARLRYELSTEARRDSPRHKEPDLLGAMTHFEVETCMLLRHGMREYCFVLTDDEAAPGPSAGDSPSSTGV